ncbi:MAG: YggT family protein [Candidatus Dormibacteraeota bacterium]|nr:YggT family protein [Candidatus Dormibacteraeota bacterium]
MTAFDLRAFLGGVIYIFILVMLVRGLLSWFPQAIYTQFGRIVIMATEWFLAPIRRVVPPAGGIDLSFLVAILILYFVRALVTSGSVVGALLSIIGNILFLLIILMGLRVALTFFRMSPWHPLVQIVNEISEPFARPFRGFFPKRYNQFDWAPVAGLVALIVILIVISNLPRFGLY